MSPSPTLPKEPRSLPDCRGLELESTNTKEGPLRRLSTTTLVAFSSTYLLVMAIYVGIDIAKDRLDVAVREVEPPEESSAEPDSTLRGSFRAENTAKGRDRLVQRITEASPVRIVLEASGGLERPVVAALGAADLPVVVVNPIQTSEFAKSLGRLEKTDPIDAEVLALFGERVRPELRPLPSEAQQELEALVKRRRQLVEMREAEKNRLNRVQEAVEPSLSEHIRYLEEQIEEVESKLEKLIEESPVWQAEEDLLCSAPGVAETTARTLLGRLPELGEANRQEIAKLVGMAPIAQESGTWKGERHIEGGRADVRQALYMATLSCIQHNEKIKTFYHRLLDKGKEKKVALIAAARKLLVILNTMLKNQTRWDPNHSPTAA
jgi:transposase